MTSGCDWDATPLGAMRDWTASLRCAVEMIRGSRVPMFIAWGDELTFLYNDAYAGLLGSKHPEAFGKKFSEIWAEIWAELLPLVTTTLGGDTVYHENLPLIVRRGAKHEEAFFTFSYSPLREGGEVAGIFAVVTETTNEVRLRQRQDFRLGLEERLRELEDPVDLMAAAAEAIGRELGVGRVGYGEIDPSGEFVVVERDWTDESMFSVAGRHRMDDFGPPIIRSLRAGEPIAVNDVQRDARVAASASAFAAIGTRSVLAVPLIKAHRLVAMIYLHHSEPYEWSAEDISLVSEVGERTWAILERFKAEMELREREEQLRLATEAAEIGLWDVDEIQKTLYWPPRVKAMFGISADVPVSMLDFYSGLHPDDRERVSAAYAAAADPSQRALYDVEYRTVGHEDGVVRWVAAKGRGVFNGDGECLRVIGTAVDITDRKIAAQRLQESESALRESVSTLDALIDNAPIGFAFLDQNCRYVRLNSVLAAINGIEAEDHIGLTVDQVVPSLAEQIKGPVEKIFATGSVLQTLEIDGETRQAPGEKRSWLTSFFPVFNADGKVGYVGCTVVDITERRRHEEAVHNLNEELGRRVNETLAEKQLLVDVIDGADVLVLVVDTAFNWLAINKAAAREFARVYGVREPSAGDNMLELLKDDPEHQEAVRARWSRALAGEETVLVEQFGKAELDRPYYEIHFRTLRDQAGNIIGAYQIVYDVTERLREQQRLKDAEAALTQAQKMEAVGQLTGGIAHDFNNLLGAIVGNFDLILRRTNDPRLVERFAATGLQAAQKGAKLTSQLLAFSRSQRIELKQVAVADVLLLMEDLLTRTLGPAVRLSIEIADPALQVLSDRTQIEMAILNVAINARDAMPEGGELFVKVMPRLVASDPELAPGKYVEISIKDTGVGMEPDVLNKACDPFFTTKPVGEGTGLGLSQVYGIAKQGGGIVRLASELNNGTIVSILLPLVRAGDGFDVSEERSEEGLDVRESAKVLVIDDDALMSDTIGSLIEALGHSVRMCQDGLGGLNVLQEYQPDVVLLDYAMPGMNGADVANAIRKLRPGVPIVFSTGYSDSLAIEAAVGKNAAVIRKPYDLKQLNEALSLALAKQAPQ